MTSDSRREYARAALDESSTHADPLEQFRTWFDEANRTGVPDANAMTLATADAKSRPSARIVLLKDVDRSGFVFYSDRRSRKGRELEANPRAALVFHWIPMERQVRIVGSVELLDAATSAAYYHTRPRGSQLGAWASEQSAALPDRATLERRVAAVTAEFDGRVIPLPAYWGGYRVVPDEVEFWQGRVDRLHDRIQYTRGTGDQWTRRRLSP